MDVRKEEPDENFVAKKKVWRELKLIGYLNPSEIKVSILNIYV